MQCFSSQLPTIHVVKHPIASACPRKKKSFFLQNLSFPPTYVHLPNVNITPIHRPVLDHQLHPSPGPQTSALDAKISRNFPHPPTNPPTDDGPTRTPQLNQPALLRIITILIPNTSHVKATRSPPSGAIFFFPPSTVRTSTLITNFNPQL